MNLRNDARIYQILSLSLMLLFGVARRDFPVSIPASVVTLATAFLAQWYFGRRAGAPAHHMMSAAISGLSILLLWRSMSLWGYVAAALLAVGSKFLLKSSGKHFFNPTNFAIVVLLFLDLGWVSPAQWGNEISFMAWAGMLGLTVLHRSMRFDISAAFLAVWSLLLLGRVWYLGQPLPVFFHQMQNGALIIFTFFMISDPRSTPDHRMGRLVFAALVAGLAFYLRVVHFLPQAPLYALFLLSPTTALFDLIWRQSRFQWRSSDETSPHSLAMPAFSP